MGNFFTTTHIYEPKILERRRFFDLFCQEMQKAGYVTCNSDESELFYALRFADCCEWVTITSDAYEQGNQFSQTDTKRIAKMLKTFCINTTVLDSDCAVLDLYDKSGNKADSLIIGRADDYFGDDIPQPSEELWKPFLSSATTWEQFSDIQNEDNTFVEESLKELAPMIGMDDQNILFSADEAHEDEQTVFLFFKKATAKGEKKLSYNAAFHQVFGKALEPLGYKKLKSKYPYYVKCINGEILHIIALISEKWGETTDSVSIVGGVETIYKKDFILAENPKATRGRWLQSLGIYYENHLIPDFDKQYRWKLYNGYIPANSSNEIILNHMEWLLSQTQKWMLPEIESAVDISSTIKYFIHYQNGHLGICLPGDKLFKFGIRNESILFFLYENIPELEYEYTNYYNRIKNFYEITGRENEAKQISIEDLVKREMKRILALRELEEVKYSIQEHIATNTAILKEYGII